MDTNCDIQAPPTSNAPAQEDNALGGFFSNILTPGSSLNPTFLLILDGAFGFLLLVLLSLFILTRGNLHLLFLMIIECCLWASVKWFVHELQQVRAQEGTTITEGAAQTGKPKTD
ncbi:hypothetical protein OH77DRAFT_1423660 [Trametes cingulata]|nr:hypothetical protein OH77DRAFT_1423660 [Trametes cingulata]